MDVTLAGPDLAALESEWRALVASDPFATPFCSFEWSNAWLHHWSEGRAPWLLQAREDGRLVGLVPLVRRASGGVRVLRGLGVGVGNYWDVIALPEARERVLTAVARSLRERRSEWDALFIDKLPQESRTEDALRASRLRVARTGHLASPRIELPEGFDAYLAMLSKSRRARVRRGLRALDDGELSVRTVSDPVELRSAIALWQELRIAWWRDREQTMHAEHRSDRFLAFTQEAVAAMVPSGQALVWEVNRGTDVVGVAINFLDPRTFYYWLWGFDAAVAKLKPGHALLAHGIRWSVESGRRYFDFMLGDEPYKYDYAPTERFVRTLAVGSSSLRSRTALVLSRAKRLSRSPGVSAEEFASSSR